MPTPLKPTESTLRPWYWIPTLYFTEGLPYFAIVVLSTFMYKSFGLSNSEIAFYTAWFYLPWVIKPLWSPFVDIYRTKRFWVISMQLLLGAGLAGIALTLPLENYLLYSLVIFWLLAFSSATHDIAADGFYMQVLDKGQQAFFVGIRSTFYRIAMITGQGLIVILAGKLENIYDVKTAWQITMALLACILVGVSIYHALVLPKENKQPRQISSESPFTSYLLVFKGFFQKQHVVVFIAFILLYRLGEAQLGKVASLFMLDDRSAGGLGLSTEAVGFIYGTVGVSALVIGGILGGILVSRHGLKAWIWWMALAINLPDLAYIYLAYVQPENSIVIHILVAIEQFGYGFGFTAFMMYLIYIAEGSFKTAHYAIATGFMAMGMMIPGMFSGWIQEQLGYPHFFIWVMIATIPSFYVISRLPLDKDFAKSRVNTKARQD
ncbi:MFS transporter [Cocleimonas sp. KMM 6892]|uniref:MFS transporter n=1 Tax=unclassified Cocleimonas TaxID=2639732 RepID=UPI002DBCBCA7|nr:MULTISPECIES: MFS transporter [unclassified Cocleimonas]MEB8432089.1 MFS transporter [Cocleimonas sp. KMM 6892]MEC4714825.1 MFS transporter [Cocleimonas sp. KMM 6895]MEC4744361.1 MFS transporter [Cocleimonas sp. KMM 6896]